MPRRALLGGLAGGALALLLLGLWQGDDYWDYSEGTYLLSAHLWNHGSELYRQMVGAQPPGVFLAGAGILRIHDSLGWMRLVLGLGQLGTGLLAARATWRLSRSQAATALAPALVLLTPWAVHEHAALTPELLAGPLLLGGALLAARPRTAAAGGALAALAVGLKFPYALPLAGIVLCSPDRRRAGLAAALTVVLMGVAAELAFGSALWRDTVTAQLHSGRRSPHQMLGIWGQEGWNLMGLVIPAAGAALLGRARIRDRPLGLVWTGLCVGLVAMALTNLKIGTGLNILVPVEAGLVPLALSGVALTRGMRAPRIAAVACIALVFAESATLMLLPKHTAWPFLYPGSQRGSWGREQPESEVHAQVANIRAHCPADRASSAEPLIIYLARRRPPGGQADGFLPVHAGTVLRSAHTAMDADVPRCP